MKNLKEIKTTIMGSILFLLGIVIFTVEYFTLGEMAWNHYVVPAVLLSIGIGLSLAPDKLLDFLFKAGEKKLS